MPVKAKKYNPEADPNPGKHRMKMTDLVMYNDYTVTREQYMRDRERT
jgi:hypothetical protein